MVVQELVVDKHNQEQRPNQLNQELGNVEFQKLTFEPAENTIEEFTTVSNRVY